MVRQLLYEIFPVNSACSTWQSSRTRSTLVLACNQSHELHKALGISARALSAFTAFSPPPNFSDSTVESFLSSPGSTIVVIMLMVMSLSVAAMVCAVLLLSVPFFLQSNLVDLSQFGAKIGVFGKEFLDFCQGYRSFGVFFLLSQTLRILRWLLCEIFDCGRILLRCTVSFV